MQRVDRNAWGPLNDELSASCAPFFQTDLPVLAIDRNGSILAASRGAHALSCTSVLPGIDHHRVLASGTANCPICSALARLDEGALPSGGAVLGANGHRYAVGTIILSSADVTAGVVAVFTPVADHDGHQVVADRHRTPVEAALTLRERDVLLCLAAGSSARDTAHELGIAYNTARNHIQNVLHKLEVRNKAEAVGRALQLGLISPGHIGRRLEHHGDSSD
jgi:DNA-binding CsgD family transcriptional regulator